MEKVGEKLQKLDTENPIDIRRIDIWRTRVYIFSPERKMSRNNTSASLDSGTTRKSIYLFIYLCATGAGRGPAGTARDGKKEGEISGGGKGVWNENAVVPLRRGGGGGSHPSGGSRVLNV